MKSILISELNAIQQTAEIDDKIEETKNAISDKK